MNVAFTVAIYLNLALSVYILTFNETVESFPHESIFSITFIALDKVAGGKIRILVFDVGLNYAKLN